MAHFIGELNVMTHTVVMNDFDPESGSFKV